MSQTDPRLQVLTDLLELRATVSQSVVELGEIGWGHDEVVDLEPGHVREVLRRLTTGELTAEDVSTWAGAIDMRDDIGRLPGAEDVLNDALFEMSSPELFAGITESAPALIARLDALGP